MNTCADSTMNFHRRRKIIALEPLQRGSLSFKIELKINESHFACDGPKSCILLSDLVSANINISTEKTEIVIPVEKVMS